MALRDPEEIDGYLRDFSLKERRTLIDGDRYINEFWTAGQRQASSIHEVSYRACFKPQLPAFFIEMLTDPGEIVYDPFSGRGTTPIEAGLRGRKTISNDINPLSRIMTEPRFFVPRIEDIEDRLNGIDLSRSDPDMDLSMFYHVRTGREIASLREYLGERSGSGEEDRIDKWIRMVATNRLAGHSPGFFSVYTLPPNQAVSPESQVRINEKRGQVPPYRDVKRLILRKSRSLRVDLTARQIDLLRRAGESAVFLSRDSRDTPEIGDGSVDLIVTSPPFLNIVQYHIDNWLRCWFNDLDAKSISKGITMLHSLDGWTRFVEDCFREYHRVVRPGGFVAFEVGEVRGGSVDLDRIVAPAGTSQGFDHMGTVVNSQNFTKTANIWGVDNMSKGTNTNRIVLFVKP